MFVMLSSVSFWVILLLYIYLYVIVYKMAAKRWRSKLGWVLVAILFTPFLAIIGLLVFGDSREKAIRDATDRIVDELRNNRPID